MAPRTILHIGTGGAGTSSVAAATARRSAARGRRTLLLSTGPEHALADVLGLPVGGEPTAITANLWAEEVDAQTRLERDWEALFDRPPFTLEEVVVPPGAREMLALLALHRHVEEEAFDVIVVDCGPIGAALPLLTVPDLARWSLRRSGATFPAALQRPLRALVALNEILGDHAHVSVRLVTTPDPTAIEGTRRACTFLALYGLHVDALVLNRVLPEEAGPYFARWRAGQAGLIDLARATFARVPILPAPFLPEPVAGPDALDHFGDLLFADRSPTGVLAPVPPHQALTVTRTAATLQLDLPFAVASEVTLKRVGPDLVVRVHGHKRTLALPPALADYRPTGATVRDGALHVRFERSDRPASDA